MPSSSGQDFAAPPSSGQDFAAPPSSGQAFMLLPSSRQDFVPTLPGVAPGAPPPAPQYPPCSPRPMAETQAYTPPPSSRKEQVTATEEAEPRTEWCVDFGRVLATMDTFELWAAIDRGDVLPSMRVWREGMECWTPIGQVPDLALAFQTPPTSRTPGPVALPPAPGAPPAPVAPAVSAPPSPRASLVQPSATAEGRPTADTLISGPRPSAWGRLSQRVLPRGSLRRAQAPLWVAAGSAVATLAILTALARVGTSSATAAPAGLPMQVVQAAALPLEAPAEPPAVEAPAAEGPVVGAVAPEGSPGGAEGAARAPSGPEAMAAPEVEAARGAQEGAGAAVAADKGRIPAAPGMNGTPGASGASGAMAAPGMNGAPGSGPEVMGPRSPREVHRDDYGQHRRGRSGRRGYGW